MSEPDNICILRFSAIGDVTHGVPLVHAIQGQLPNAHIHLLIGDLGLLAALADSADYSANRRGALVIR